LTNPIKKRQDMSHAAFGMARFQHVRLATIQRDRWQLESAEARHTAHPTTFWIPSRLQREALQPGDGAKLLFRVEALNVRTQAGLERMWVIVRRRAGELYVGVLDSTPAAEELAAVLKRGDEIVFAPEHVADISTPPREYVVQQFGKRFFDE
jgi:hypothetical protein